jgi:hypothetical protein
MMRIALTAMSLLLLTLSTSSGAKPSHQDIQLKTLTTLTLKFYPGMGTRFTFPFLLDNDDGYVPYTNDNTNSTVFVPIKRQNERNFFVITIPPEHVSDKEDIGNMFITVAGYQISIEMHSTKNRNEHVSDIRFIMGEKAREDLIQHAIVQRTKALEQSYKEKLAQLEVQTEKRALGKVGMLALYTPDEIKIKEESVLELKNGDETVLFVNYALVYPEYTIYSFVIENDSSINHVVIQDAKLFAIDREGGQKIPLDSAKEIPKRVEPRGSATGVIVVDNSILDREKRLTLEVLTDGGSVQAIW